MILEWRPICWLGDQMNTLLFTRKEQKVGRPACDETSCCKDFLFLDSSIESYP